MYLCPLLFYDTAALPMASVAPVAPEIIRLRPQEGH